MTRVLKALNPTKRCGSLTADDRGDLAPYPGEIRARIGDNGTGKSTLIKALCGAVALDGGTIALDGKSARFGGPMGARDAGIETVYQTLALSPDLAIADNMFPGREFRRTEFLDQWCRMPERREVHARARGRSPEPGVLTIQTIGQPVQTLSGGQNEGVAMARAAAFAGTATSMDEPTAALGVEQRRRELDLIRDVKARGLPIVVISHNMPHVFEIANRIHIDRLGRRHAVIRPEDFAMSDAVATMIGATDPPADPAGMGLPGAGPATPGATVH